MPIYEYRCASCGHELEALQKLSDAPLTVCPTCAKAALVKRVSAAGFQLKGSGWYVTDYGDSGRKQPGKAAANGNGEGKTSDAKPVAAKSGESATAPPAASSGAAAAAPSSGATSGEKTGT